MPPSFLAALHEAGRTAARDESRYALTRVQLQGKAGQILGTDGKQALIQGGWTFPFTDNILVPAIPMFGMKDVAAQADVRIGKTATHLVVTAGPWTVWLLIDAEGRFPDVAAARAAQSPDNDAGSGSAGGTDGCGSCLACRRGA